MSKPLDQARRQQIINLHADGHARNEIARRVGVSSSTVSKVCKQEGLDFDRTQTVAATRAKSVDAKAMRAEIALKLLQKANGLLDEMDGPRIVFNFGGKDNTYEQHILDSAPTGDKRNLMQAAATALAKHEALVKMDQTMENHSAVDAWLEHITSGGAQDGSTTTAGQEPPSVA